jgi:uncharacterized protein (DUF305 family)
MQTKSLVVGGVVGLILGLIISPTIFQGGGMMNGSARFGIGGGRGDQMMTNIDRHFIEQMIPPHDGAIEMAELALEKSKRPEILSLANGIISAQKKEINDMNAWYKDWFGTEVPDSAQSTTGGGHMMNNGHMMGGGMHMDSMSGDLEALKNSKNFDLEFINQMIPHHEMAVMMAIMLKGSTNRPEMAELADNIITSQTREIEMMRSWATAWSR